jgi:hypothetical protein
MSSLQSPPDPETAPRPKIKQLEVMVAEVISGARAIYRLLRGDEGQERTRPRLLSLLGTT